jgi:hypothetical protein
MKNTIENLSHFVDVSARIFALGFESYGRQSELFSHFHLFSHCVRNWRLGHPGLEILPNGRSRLEGFRAVHRPSIATGRTVAFSVVH